MRAMVHESERREELRQPVIKECARGDAAKGRGIRGASGERVGADIH